MEELVAMAAMEAMVVKELLPQLVLALVMLAIARAAQAGAATVVMEAMVDPVAGPAAVAMAALFTLKLSGSLERYRSERLARNLEVPAREEVVVRQGPEALRAF